MGVAGVEEVMEGVLGRGNACTVLGDEILINNPELVCLFKYSDQS
jgi:hypothetical protein